MDYSYEGSREFIKNRLEIYLPFLMPLKEVYPEGSIIDSECGKGVWLELLKENGMNARGTALDESTLSICQDLGLAAIQGSTIEVLQEQADESLMAVSAFHMIGSTPLNKLQEFVTEALRTLKPGGLLIMETPNHESVKATPEHFYIDSSHTQSIPSALLSFIKEYKILTGGISHSIEYPLFNICFYYFLFLSWFISAISTRCFYSFKFF